MDPFEQSLMWSQLMEACRLCAIRQEYKATSDETSCVMAIHRDFPVKTIRNWLDKDFDGECTMTGIYVQPWKEQQSNYPVAVRFRFDSFDEKLLFALRWL